MGLRLTVIMMLILIFFVLPVAYPQTMPNREELSTAKKCYERWFGAKLKDEADLFPGSFWIDGVWMTEKSSKWIRKIEEVNRDKDKIHRRLTLTEPELGLEIRYEGVLYKHFPVVEWTAYYKNIAPNNSPLLHDLKTIDQVFHEFAGKKVTLHRNKGDDCCNPDSYQPIVEDIKPESEMTLANVGGRPTQITFPYFNFEREQDGGMIFVISWAGQWSTAFKRDASGNLRIQGGQELTRFFLYPGEEVRGPMVVIMPYTGDKRRGQNIWRQWMIAHNLARPNGKPPKLPLLLACSSHQFEEMIKADTASQLFFIEQYIKRGFPLDYWWMDAGWYPCDGSWPKTGTWVVDETRFPGGFKPISDFAHERGIKILVWFEPERVHSGTWLAENHPDWIYGGKDGGLLKLGNSEVREWLTNHIDNLLTTQGIDLYRQDFNINPLDFWRNNDEPNRQGINEIRHVEGYFAYWDELRRRHPDMLIDSCASGGRRNDLETLRRAVPLLRSDYIMEPNGNQCHTWALAEWFPFFGTGSSKTSDYFLLSVMCPSFTACFDQRIESLPWERLREIILQRYLYAENYFGDYYPLTSYSLEKNVWMAWQFNLEKKGTGFVQAFRREESPIEEMQFKLFGLKPNKLYKITPLDKVTQPYYLAGKQLMTEGLPIRIPTQPGAIIILYEMKVK